MSTSLGNLRGLDEKTATVEAVEVTVVVVLVAKNLKLWGGIQTQGKPRLQPGNFSRQGTTDTYPSC